MTCSKLLNNGSRGKYGCDGTKCGKFHPKMCPVSLQLKSCPPDCKNGFHVRSNSRAMQEKKKKEEKAKKELEEKERKTEEEREIRRDQYQQPLQQPSAPIQSKPNDEAFLAEIRREVLRVLMTVLPVALAPPVTHSLGQASVGNPAAAGLNWAAALQLNRQ